MLFNNYRLDKIIPADKTKYGTLDEYKNRFLSNVRFLQFKEPEGEFDNLLSTLYQLDNDKYTLLIKKFKTDYYLLKKTADLANNIILTEENPIDSLNCILEMYKNKKSVVNRMVTNLVNTDSPVEKIKKCIEDIDSHESIEVEICKEELSKRFANIVGDNELLKEYSISQIEDVRTDLHDTTYLVLRKKLLKENKSTLVSVDSVVAGSKKRFHRK